MYVFHTLPYAQSINVANSFTLSRGKCKIPPSITKYYLFLLMCRKTNSESCLNLWLSCPLLFCQGV